MKEITSNTVKKFFEKLNEDLRSTGNSEAIEPLTNVAFYTEEIKSVFGLEHKEAAAMAREMAI